MSYSLPQDINDIRSFYKNGGAYFNSVLPQVVAHLALGSDAVQQSQIAREVNTKTKSFSFLLRKTILMMLCSAWESFVDELKLADNPRYAGHFTLYAKWYNEPIHEIVLLRNCIAHRKGKIDSEYLRKTKLPTFTAIGTVIDFTEPEIDIFFKTFEDAYIKITT